MTMFPERIVRSAGPADHASPQKETQDWDDHHAERRSADVRDRVERELAAESGGAVAANFGDESVRCFVASGGEKKGDIPDERESQCFRREIGHRELRLGCNAAECKEGGMKRQEAKERG